jgi:hypothetical protein
MLIQEPDRLNPTPDPPPVVQPGSTELILKHSLIDSDETHVDQNGRNWDDQKWHSGPSSSSPRPGSQSLPDTKRQPVFASGDPHQQISADPNPAAMRPAQRII